MPLQTAIMLHKSAICNPQSAMGMKVSVIIPALNEEGYIAQALESVRRQDGDYEIIVVDGGSADRTRAMAGGYGRVLDSPAGRAVQMNAGARAATGDVFLFLHADSVLADGSFAALRQALCRPEFAGGCFRMEFDHRHAWLWFYTRFTRFRYRLFHYGDQGLFLRRSVFEALGGYREVPIMEDVDLLKRLRRHGRLAVLDPPITTSARRYHRHGFFLQELLNVILVSLYMLGVRPEVLRRWYDDVR